ncbi:MAG TPA: hypothetical protein VLK25_05370 [Allosphingosinicella sp.]|nr:hypothetical protein [Allosphingosinicella sp.]
MDVPPGRHYVAGAMSFLLVLSAVFNALTGAFVGVRAAEPVSHQQMPAEAATVAETVVQKAVPAASLVAASKPEAPVVAETAAPDLAAPLETDRLIE